MLTEISLHVLDVAQNSVRAGASFIEISMEADTKKDRLIVTIKDNGCGMSKNQAEQALDPFYTTRTTRRIGLGIPFFKQAAEGSGGNFELCSKEGEGTLVRAIFGLSHIDRMPVGDINAAIYTLIVYNEQIDFHYRYALDGREFVLDTREMREILGDISFQDAEVSRFIKDYLAEGKKEVDDGTLW